MHFLHLANNSLTGPIPPELGNLTGLNSLFLYDNRLTGPIPGSLARLPLEWFWFQANDGLCAPGTASFAAWLEGIDNRRGAFCNESDRAVLESLFEAAGGTGWTDSSGWLATPTLEEWYGVTVDSLGRVVTLVLTRNGLAGHLPPHLGTLDEMTRLRIGGNALSGRLPLSLTGLALVELDYADTELCVPAEAEFQAWLNAVPSHTGTGVECAPLTNREILVALYQATGGTEWGDAENWLTDAPLGDWYGVSVDAQGRVTALHLAENNLSGPIPPGLANLTHLTQLQLSANALTGPVPSELGGLVNLRGLHLYGNDLTGPIPSELGGLVNLRSLTLSWNDLSGPIPSELGSLVNLGSLYLGGNDLSGPIPSELGNLASLHALYLSGNNLTGSIPSELGSLVNLESLYLAENDLSGPIPPALGKLANLTELRLNGNALSGSVPPAFGGLTGLRELVLSANIGMSGRLPNSLTNLQSLETLQVGQTGLCAPSEASFLEWLEGVLDRWVALCEGGAAYLTQAVQSRQFPVPLVAGEQALLRVFVTAARANNERIPPVRASFYLGGALAHAVEIAGKPGPISTEIEEGSLARSANAEIPGEVVQPGLEMVVEIDPEGTLDRGLGVAKRIPETGRTTVAVHAMPFLDLTLIPFLWQQAQDSTILDSVREMATDPQNHELLWATRTLLPVGGLEVRAHEPVLSSSNFSEDLLVQTAMIRVMEGGTGHYMGTISQYSGSTGVGELGGRVSFAAPRATTMAHELGHNFSLLHAPCGGASGPDPLFPYSDGSTGAWGYDFAARGTLVSPDTPDLMSYCNPDWISDYHFDKALRFRLADEGATAAAATATAPTPSLLLWGRTDAEGRPHLEPVFVVDAPALLPVSAGEYRLTGRSAADRDLFTLDFAMPETTDGDGRSSFVFALPAPPEWADDLASVTLSGPGGSITLDGDSDIPMTILRDPRTGRIRGFLREGPLAAQAAADAAGGPAGPGLETIFSRGIPDAAWRR